ncbi:hypothetical protein HAX54_019747, partial [Datura stramonium]|nr:hypothetical protein [Datura stramonium]
FDFFYCALPPDVFYLNQQQHQASKKVTDYTFLGWFIFEDSTLTPDDLVDEEEEEEEEEGRAEIREEEEDELKAKHMSGFLMKKLWRSGGV